MPFINSTYAKADSIVAASADHENTQTEAVFAASSVTIPANSLAVGDVIRIRAAVKVTDNNSTDTLTCTLRMGTAGTAADQAIVATNAQNSEDGDVVYFDADIVIRTIGSSGTMVAAGFSANGVPNTHDGAGTVVAALPFPFILTSTAINTTVAQYINVSADWSVAHADNECNLEVLNVQVIKQTP